MFTVILLDVGRFEILWVLDVVEDTTEGWEPVGIICKMRLVPCVDDLSCVYPGIGYFFMVVAAAVVAILLIILNSSRTRVGVEFLLDLLGEVEKQRVAKGGVTAFRRDRL